jgi:AhpD family alkylhydroperoxidase
MTTTQHPPRVQLSKLSPAVYEAMIALDKASAAGLDKSLADLIRIRASQLNGCTYCIDMHTRDARDGGETEQRIYLLASWREVPDYYSEKEQAALALTEAVTLLSESHVPDDVYERAAKHFPDEELSQLISLLVTINAWNRVGVTTRLAIGS